MTRWQKAECNGQSGVYLLSVVIRLVDFQSSEQTTSEKIYEVEEIFA